MKIRSCANFVFFLIFSFYISTVFAEKPSCKEEYLNLRKKDLVTHQEKISIWKSLKGTCEPEKEHKVFLGNLYMRENLEKAKEIYEEIISEGSNDFAEREAQKMLTAIYYERKQFDLVKKKSEELMKKYPKWHVGYVFFGISLIGLENNYLKANEYFNKSIELEETWDGRCWQAVVAYYQFKDYQKAFELYDRALQLDMVAILETPAAIAGIDSAMIIEEWDAARWMLETHKAANEKLNNNIESCDQYKRLKEKMDEYDKTKGNVAIKADKVE